MTREDCLKKRRFLVCLDRPSPYGQRRLHDAGESGEVMTEPKGSTRKFWPFHSGKAPTIWQAKPTTRMDRYCHSGFQIMLFFLSFQFAFVARMAFSMIGRNGMYGFVNSRLYLVVKTASLNWALIAPSISAAFKSRAIRLITLLLRVPYSVAAQYISHIFTPGNGMLRIAVPMLRKNAPAALVRWGRSIGAIHSLSSFCTSPRSSRRRLTIHSCAIRAAILRQFIATTKHPMMSINNPPIVQIGCSIPSTVVITLPP